MSPSTARRTALSAIALSVVVAATTEAIKEKRPPRMRVFVGGAVAAVILTTFANVLPQLVHALSIIIIITVSMTSGYDLIEPIQSLITN